MECPLSEKRPKMTCPDLPELLRGEKVTTFEEVAFNETARDIIPRIIAAIPILSLLPLGI